MSFCWIWGIYFMDYVGLRNDFGMEKKLGAVSGGIGIVRVMAAAWLISVMFSAVGMVLASLIFYAVGEGQNRIRVSVYMVVVLSVLIGGIYAGHRIGYRRFLWGLALGALYYVTLCLISAASGCMAAAGWQFCLPFVLLCLGSGMLGGMLG